MLDQLDGVLRHRRDRGLNVQHPFKILEPEYTARLSGLKITRPTEVRNRAMAILRRPEVLTNFHPVEEATGIPMLWMICSFERESGLDFRTSPAQGDRWDRRSVNVPRGVGPFKSFTEAAIWSYKYDAIDQNSAPWSWPYMCWAWEKFNGFGPRDHGRVSGYVFSGTNQYDPPSGKGGKYVSDGHWSPGAVDQQLGCIPLALELLRLEPSLGLDEFVPTIPDVEAPIVPVTPSPDGVNGGLKGVGWLQHSLNQLRVTGTPLGVDGSYGRRTRNAVRAFQASHGLDADGLAGDKTCDAIDAELRKI